MSDQMWKPDPLPMPEEGPAWPGNDERVSYRGLSLQPEADFDWWGPIDDRWELSLTLTGGPLLVIYAERDRALSIATRLADAKDWRTIDSTPDWNEIAFDPLILRLMADYPDMISLPILDDLDEPESLDEIIPYRDEPDSRWALF